MFDFAAFGVVLLICLGIMAAAGMATWLVMWLDRKIGEGPAMVLMMLMIALLVATMAGFVEGERHDQARGTAPAEGTAGE